MRRRPYALSFVAPCLSIATAVSSTACEPADDPPPGGMVAFVDEWDTVYRAQMAVDVPQNPNGVNVAVLPIGHAGVADNFMNRGDVEVFYTLDPAADDGVGEIIVQLQRFTGAADQDDAESRFERLQAWVDQGPLEPPDVETSACSEAFVEGCRIAVYYEGLVQPARDGANMRVFLPRNFRGAIEVTTRDNLWPDGALLDRSDVRVVGLYGEANVELESGRAEIVLAEDLMPAPRCGETDTLAREANANCESFVDPDTGELSPWNKDCGCQGKFGVASVKTLAPESADIIVDAPADLFMAVSASSEESLAPGLCRVDVRCEEFESCEPPSCGDDGRCDLTVNDPGAEFASLGYRLSLESDACSEVRYHQAPNDYGTAPRSEQRGDIEVCSGCLDASAPAVPG